MSDPGTAASLRRAALSALLLIFADSAVRSEPEPGSAEPSANAVLATLPFLPGTPPHRIVIDLAPEGNARRLPFQLDTGADVSFVSPRLARSMGVKVSRTKEDPYRRKTVLGRDVLFYVDTRRSDTGSGSGMEFGLLGGSFLAEYVVEIDFSKRQVRFLDPERFQVPKQTRAADEAVIPLLLVSNRPGLRVALNGFEVNLLLDTGAEPGLMLSGAHARKAKIRFEDAPACSVYGVVGDTSCHVALLERFEIGSFVLERQQALVAPNGFFNLGYAGDSLMGFDLLDQFLVRIDYPRERLWLRRAPAARADAAEQAPEPP